MAREDFAHLNAPHPEDVRPIGQMKVLLLILVALAVVGGGFVVGFMTGQEMGMQKATSEDEARLVAQLKKQQEELAKLRAEAGKRLPEVSTTQVGELTFYNELPRQSVDPEPMHADSVSVAKRGKELVKQGDPAQMPSETLLKQIIEQEMTQRGDDKAAVTPVVYSSALPGAYYVQLASFQQRSDAEVFYPKLGKAGFEGSIKEVDLAERGVWYRVYAGPFASKEASEEAKKQAKSRLNITGLIVKGG